MMEAGRAVQGNTAICRLTAARSYTLLYLLNRLHILCILSIFIKYGTISSFKTFSLLKVVPSGVLKNQKHCRQLDFILGQSTNKFTSKSLFAERPQAWVSGTKRKKVHWAILIGLPPRSLAVRLLWLPPSSELHWACWNTEKMWGN